MTPTPASCRILLVDDRPAILDDLRRLLEDRGHRVEPFAGVLYAMWAVNASRRVYDLVTSAVELSDGDGVELLSHLRRRMGVRTIALTWRGPESGPRRRATADCPSIDAVFPHPACARPHERLAETVCDAACALLAAPQAGGPLTLPPSPLAVPPSPPARLQA